jgi:parvulin-like peptidyl-prolyl isomerase
MYIGTVVAEVNGQPIYADKILSKVDAELSAKAPLLEPGEFRAAATNAILKQIRYDIALEQEFAAAQRNTTPEEQGTAERLAAMWRQREIIKAGGSLAVARRMSLDKDGIDFEEKVKEQYQSYMILIYFQNRIEPRVQISGDDMRRYYDMNVGQLFTDKAGVRFRAIFVSAKQKAGREAALKTAEELLQRAKDGEDFAKLATDYNDDPTRRENHGWWMINKREEGEQTITEPAWIERGSLAQRYDPVEKAAYALNVGEITPAPIDVGDGFYIVKLEQKQNGQVRPFDNPDVQTEIRRRLGADQRRTLRDKEYAKLAKQSVVRQDEEKILTTVDMAMQKYFAWSRANGLTRANPDPVGGTSR